MHVMKRLFEVVEHMVKEDGMHMSEAHQKPFSESATCAATSWEADLFMKRGVWLDVHPLFSVP